MTDDLVAFLRARFDEDERTARAVRVPYEWHQGPGDDWEPGEMVCMRPPEFHTPYEQDKHWRGETVGDSELAAHIARHDPARVLAEVDAKRRIIDLHALEYRDRPERVLGEADDPFCAECFGDGFPCETLRLLAWPFASHPDYLPEWAPDA